MKRILGILGALLQSISAGSATPPPELPAETFCRDFETGEVELSPDGHCLAIIAPLKERHNLLALDLETSALRWLTTFSDCNVHSINWANDERVLLRVEQDGVESFGLFAINRDGKEARTLVQALFRGDRTLRPYRPVFLSRLPAEPKHVLVSSVKLAPESRPDALSFPDVESMQVFTGAKTLLVKNPGNVVQWLPDHQGLVRAALAIEGSQLCVLQRPDVNSKWRTLVSSSLSEGDIELVCFTADNENLLVIASPARNTAGLYVLDVKQGTFGECLWQNADYDAQHVVVSPKDHRPLCVFYEDEHPRCEWLDVRWRGIQASIDAALTNTVNLMVSLSRDESKAVFHCFNDRTPGAYYLFDATKRRLAKLRDLASWIKEEQMAPMRPISYKTRDNLTIHGYLTLPLGSTGTNLPLVVIPHGGPWMRDSWVFDPEVQFLANRGYAVLQPNFRGSTGYGQAFLKAGFKEWGRKMQDDITDAVNWALSEGIADKHRIAIYGASYGGYAALAGLTETPELYKCGVSYAGVTDIEALLKADAEHAPRLIGFELEAVGNSKKERSQLRDSSPINHVDRIQSPVLLIYGGQDQRVDISQGRRLARELKAHNKPFEMILESEEGHGFHIEKNRIEMHRKLEAFLKKNL